MSCVYDEKEREFGSGMSEGKSSLLCCQQMLRDSMMVMEENEDENQLLLAAQARVHYSTRKGKLGHRTAGDAIDFKRRQ